MADETCEIDRWLSETKFINHQHPTIKELASQLTWGLGTDKEKAVAIHNWVRDNIMFGWTKSFWCDSATDVLKAKMGFCNTKSTLFIALLRCSGIPARQMFVTIHRDILKGIVTPRTDYLDHSYCQVYLEGKWVNTDSYILDSKLFEVAQSKLASEIISIGYGTILGGSNKWDGEHDSFSQFLNDGRVDYLSNREFGLYEDMEDFYANASNTTNGARLIRFLFFLLHWKFNKNIEQIRKL